MKKVIITVSIAMVMINCKKGELNASTPLSTIQTDSISNEVNNLESNSAASLEKLADSAYIDISKVENTVTDAQKTMQQTVKSVDSLSEKISSLRLNSQLKLKDSATKKQENIVIHVPEPKIIEKTKVIYKDKPQPKVKAVENRLQKYGSIEVKIDNTSEAKNWVSENVDKYDGKVKSENLSQNENLITFIRIEIPTEKFDYLIDDISQNLGEVKNKNLEVIGYNLVPNSTSSIDLTLQEYSTADIAAQKPSTFGDRSFEAIKSGWNVIMNIFLFVLPFWPLLLMVGIAYIFYRKKKQTETK